MVSKVLKLLHKEVGAVNQAALLLGFFTFLSQILGLVRDRMFTTFLGAGRDLDIYYTAFQVPDILFNLVATLVSVTVLLPVLVSLTKKEGLEKAQNFFSQVFTVFFVLVIVLSVVAFILMPFIAPIVAPGFSAEELQTLVKLSRIILFSPVLLGFSNLLGSVTQMMRRFVLFAVSPILYNLGILIGIAVFYRWFGLVGLAYGVVLGALLHMLIQVPALIKDSMLPRLTQTISWVGIKTLALTSLPRTVGLTIHGATLVVLIAFATTIQEGSVSIFRLSMNLQNVPLALIGASFSVAAFPTLAHDFSNGNTQKFLRQIRNAGRQIIFWSIPVTVLFIVLRAQIVRTILGSKAFTWEDTRLAAATLAMFVVSVVAQSLILLFTRGFYAAGDTLKPVLINLISSAFIVMLALLLPIIFDRFEMFSNFFTTILRAQNISGIRVVMLALAYSIGSIINALLLLYFFKRKYDSKHNIVRFGGTFADSFLGSVIMGLVSYSLLVFLSQVFDLASFQGIFFQGLFAGLGAIVVGFVFFYALGSREFIQLMQSFYHKMRRVNSVPVTHEDLLE